MIAPPQPHGQRQMRALPCMAAMHKYAHGAYAAWPVEATRGRAMTIDARASPDWPWDNWRS